MDESFEISAVDGSFHEEQEVGSQYECNECTYKTCCKQNLKRHKHAKHPIPVAMTPTQAVVLMCHHCGTEFKSNNSNNDLFTIGENKYSTNIQ